MHTICNSISARVRGIYIIEVAKGIYNVLYAPYCFQNDLAEIHAYTWTRINNTCVVLVHIHHIAYRTRDGLRR